MYEQFGGVVCVEPQSTENGYTPVSEMLTSSSAKISLLSYSTRYGFMFELNVATEHSKYVNLNPLTGEFDIPVTNYILKITVITETDHEVFFVNDIKKRSETRESFSSEASIQQTAWVRSIVGNREAICPSVAVLYFCNNNESKLFLNGFLGCLPPDPTPNVFEIFSSKKIVTARTIVDKLHTLTTRNSNYGIGIIIMPKLQDAIPLYNFLFDLEKLYTDIINVKTILKVLRLFFVGIIHFDLHNGNILVYRDNSEIKVSLIDFGRASDFLQIKKDEFLTVEQKNRLIEIRLTLLENLRTNAQLDNRVIHDKFINKETRLLDNKFFIEWLSLYLKYKTNTFSDIDTLLLDEMQYKDSEITRKMFKKRKIEGSIFSYTPPPDTPPQIDSEMQIDSETKICTEPQLVTKSKKRHKNGGKTQKRKYKKLIRFSTSKQFKPKRPIKIRRKIKNERRKTNKTNPRRKMQRTRNQRV
jgi:hypothetical protein